MISSLVRNNDSVVIPEYFTEARTSSRAKSQRATLLPDYPTALFSYAPIPLIPCCSIRAYGSISGISMAYYILPCCIVTRLWTALRIAHKWYLLYTAVDSRSSPKHAGNILKGACRCVRQAESTQTSVKRWLNHKSVCMTGLFQENKYSDFAHRIDELECMPLRKEHVE